MGSFEMADLPDFLVIPQPFPASGGQVPNPGKNLSRLRKEKDWTLAEVSKKTGVAISTLSKIENNKSSPTYEVLVRLAEGLGQDFVELMDGGSVRFAPGIRTINRRGQDVRFTILFSEYQALSTELAYKALQPMIVGIPFDGASYPRLFSEHSGEEFVYVLEGEIEFFMDPYAATRLTAGDSVHFDANMRHSFLALGGQDAVILVVCFANKSRSGMRKSS
jgi:transcriptional regulator with XRE-family HTH domain